MRIAYLTGEYPRATDTFVQREIAAQRKLGVEIHTFAIRRPHEKETVGPEQEAERARTFYLLPCHPFHLLAAHASCLARSPRRYVRAFKLAIQTSPPGAKGLLFQFFYFAEAALLARRIHQIGLPHLHNHFANSSCSVAMIAAEMGGFTYSFTLHGPAIFFEPHHWRIDEKIRRALFVSCISHFCRSQGMIFAPLDAWDRMHIIHCGVAPEFYEPSVQTGTGHRLLYVGRIAAVKGLPTLLHALIALRKIHPDARLTVVGDGPDRSRLEAMTRELGLADAVRFVGYQSQAQVRDHLRETDVFVMASFAEGVPVVLMEAMATAVPVVATRVAGVAELVEDGVAGYLVPPGDPVALAEQIGSLLADGPLRTRFGAAGRARVADQFNIATEAARLHRIMAASGVSDTPCT